MNKKIVLSLVIGLSFWASSASASLSNPCSDVSQGYNDAISSYIQRNNDLNTALRKAKADALTASTADKAKYTADLKIKDDEIASLKKDKEELERKIVNLESNSQKLITEYELKISDLNKSLDTAKNVAPTVIYKTEKVMVPAPVKKETIKKSAQVSETSIKTEVIPTITPTPVQTTEIPVKQSIWHRITNLFK